MKRQLSIVTRLSHRPWQLCALLLEWLRHLPTSTEQDAVEKSAEGAVQRTLQLPLWMAEVQHHASYFSAVSSEWYLMYRLSSEAQYCIVSCIQGSLTASESGWEAVRRLLVTAKLDHRCVQPA